MQLRRIEHDMPTPLAAVNTHPMRSAMSHPMVTAVGHWRAKAKKWQPKARTNSWALLMWPAPAI
jgi:hypothetical protein